jgi:CBS domain-containing protein
VGRWLAERGASAAAVVGPQGEVLGIITEHDLVRHAAQRMTVAEAGRFVTEDRDYQDIEQMPADLSSTLVEKVMRHPVYGVDRQVGVAVAANILRERGVHRLVVTDRGRLVGMISALDLMRVVEESC